LQNAEHWLDMMAGARERPAEMVVMNEEEFRRLPGAIAMYRAGLALAMGNIPDTMIYAQRVLDLAPENDDVLHGAAAGILGIAYWTVGDLDAAYRLYTDGMTHLQKAGHISDTIGGGVILGDIRIAQGRLHDAMRIYELGLQLAVEHGTSILRGTADMYVGISELERERNDLSAATQHLLRSKEQGWHTGFPQNPYRWCVVMARVRQAEGDLNGALALLHEAERVYMSDFSPNVRPVAAWKARILVAQGRLGEALNWAHERGLYADDDLSYLREFEHITLARVLLAQSNSNPVNSSTLDVMKLLERLLTAAQEGGRMGSAIETLILQALTYHVQSDISAALIPLQQALILAEPEGYIRKFLDEGLPMVQLLREANAHGIMPGYTGKLLTSFEAQSQGSASASPIPVIPASQSLIEPLSQRELELLRLLKTDLSGPEIANQLVIALSTVRTHTKSIYNKLNVNDRREAVKRAGELGLI
jgi:LuxR family maltose regulon positive regulatory protein